MRLLAISALIGGITLLGSCTRSSSWADMRFSVTADVDGKRVKASAIWRTKFVEGFPEGGYSRIKGSALAIPIGNDGFVYGIFLATGGNTILSWDVLATGLDAYVSNRDEQNGLPPQHFDSRARFRDYAVNTLAGRGVEFCVSGNQRLAGQGLCPIFVYYKHSNDPQSLQMIRPNQVELVKGHKFQIKQVTLAFLKDNGRSPPRDSRLPFFVNDKNAKVGLLPKGLVIGPSRQLYGHDFWRDE